MGGLGRAEAAKEAAAASVGICALVWATKAVASAWPAAASAAATLSVGVMLYAPILMAGRRGISMRTLGLYWGEWRRDLVCLLAISALTLPPFVVAHHFFRSAQGLEFALALPRSPVARFAEHLIAAALAEEIFFRGYLQERFDRGWPPRRRIWGAPMGGGAFAAVVVFALIHYLGEFDLARLATAGPGLLFAWLRARTGRLLAPVGYHAACNIVSDLAAACYGIGV